MQRDAELRAREVERIERAKAKWTRREESDFYRVVSSFGVESNKRGRLLCSAHVIAVILIEYNCNCS